MPEAYVLDTCIYRCVLGVSGACEDVAWCTGIMHELTRKLDECEDALTQRRFTSEPQRL